MASRSFHELFDEMVEQYSEAKTRLSKIRLTADSTVSQARALLADDACVLLEDALRAISLLADEDVEDDDD